MANLTIKQIPEDLVDRIKAEAGVNGRSMNKEIIACLESRYPLRLCAEEQIQEAKKLWEDLGRPDVGLYDPEWKRQGRP